MQPLEALDCAAAESGRRIRAIGTDDWDRPTPCAGWTVRELATHLVGGNRMAVDLLAGATSADALARLGGDLLGGDAADAFERSAAEARGAFTAPGALERTVHHPAGDVSGAALLGFRIGDLTLHAWDLARALGTDESLDPDLARYVLDAMLPIAGALGASGRFGDGPSGTVPDDAPVQLRLLDLSGRRP